MNTLKSCKRIFGGWKDYNNLLSILLFQHRNVNIWTSNKTDWIGKGNKFVHSSKKLQNTFGCSYRAERFLRIGCHFYSFDEPHSYTPTFISRFKEGVLSLDEIYQHLIDENGREIVVMKLAEHINYVKYFIIVTANSSRHLEYMAESLNVLYKRMKSPSDPFTIIEGKRTCGDWHCIDLGNSVVHFMLEEVRDKYQLEKLWLLGPKYDDLLKDTPTMEEIYDQVSKEGLRLFSNQMSDSATFIDDVDITNPWETSYTDFVDVENKATTAKDTEQDDDAYII